MCPAAAVCVSTLGVHRSREETGVVCFLDPVLTPLQAFVRLSFISTSWTSDWREYFTFAVYINNLYFHVSWTLICHLLISSCLWILPLLLSRKDTWVSLYCVMTSTNFLDSTVCWGQVGKHEDVTLEVHFMAVYKRHIVFPLPNRGLRFVLGSNFNCIFSKWVNTSLQKHDLCVPADVCEDVSWPVFSGSWSQQRICSRHHLWACCAPWLFRQRQRDKESPHNISSCLTWSVNICVWRSSSHLSLVRTTLALPLISLVSALSWSFVPSHKHKETHWGKKHRANHTLSLSCKYWI